MNGIDNEAQLQNTLHKLDLVGRQIQKAKARATSAETEESITSLVHMANQLREEIIRYRSHQARRAS
ncbi:MAG TPA: hypothetical protein VFC78_02090 [Tepidisphaeraceae bacterium]|nr:hypothetical protein [Tepidisphaeraceae bacterium]